MTIAMQELMTEEEWSELMDEIDRELEEGKKDGNN